MSRVAVSGASGLVGSALVASLVADGIDVVRLVRRAPGPGEASYDEPGQVDAVVHLAGEPISGRWTEERKAEIRRSRVDLTGRLSTALAARLPPGTPFVSASAMGWYGDRLEPVDESGPPGRGFLAELAQDWERATAPAEAVGLRVVHLRVGLVLARESGLLPAMLPSARMGLGGPIGGGRQGMSWIHRADLVAAIRFVLDRADLSGPVNGTAPTPVCQRDFAAALGRALGRPAIVPVPGFALRLLLGQGAELVLDGQFVIPARLLAAGFAFRFPTLPQALADLLPVSPASG